ncbi:MAG: hypothetical protein V3T31_06040, partial [candidate division Zixibacteria bacterium]
ILKWILPGKPTRLKGVALFFCSMTFFFIAFGMTVDDLTEEGGKDSNRAVSGIMTAQSLQDTSQDQQLSDDSIVLSGTEDSIQPSTELGITRDSLLGAINSWNPDIGFIALENGPGVVGMSGQSVISILGTEDNSTGVVIVVMINQNVQEMIACGIDLVMLSDAVVDGSSAWVEEMVDIALANPSVQLEKSQVFDGKSYQFAYLPNQGGASIGLSIQGTMP